MCPVGVVMVGRELEHGTTQGFRASHGGLDSSSLIKLHDTLTVLHRALGKSKLADEKIQVEFSTLECDPEQDEDDDSTYGYRFVCVVSYSEARGMWVVENHEEPVEI